jgi:hypothetical protein
VFVKGDQWALIRARPSYDDMLKAERIAPWLEK